MKIYSDIRVLNEITAMTPLAKYCLDTESDMGDWGIFEKHAGHIYDQMESVKSDEDSSSYDMVERLYEVVDALNGTEAVVEFFNIGIKFGNTLGLIHSPTHGTLATFNCSSVKMEDEDCQLPAELILAATEFADNVIACVHNLYDDDEHRFTDEPFYLNFIVPLREDLKKVELSFNLFG